MREGKSDCPHYSELYNVLKHGYCATLHSGESSLTANRSETLRNTGILSNRNSNRLIVNANDVAANSRSDARMSNGNQNVTLKAENLLVREEAGITRVAAELMRMLRSNFDRNNSLTGQIIE